MRIALIILHADAARGGAERYTVDLAAALARRGNDVSLLAGSFAASVDGVRQVRLEASGGASRAGRYRRFLHSLEAHRPHEKYDILHAMVPVSRCDVYHPHAGMAVEMTRPLDRLLRPRRWMMARVERQLLGGPHPPLVIALSEYVKQSIRRYYPLADDRLATLFNAVDLDRFDPRDGRDEPRPAGRPVVGLMIANDFARKGLAEAIDALARLRDQPVRLLVAGKQDPGRYRRRAEQLGAAVEFAGPVADPRPQYRSADFFLLPTHHDPCSLVVLEALVMGLPVISTRYNGACEIMTCGEHGIVLDSPADIGALADAIRRMLDPGQRAKMRTACLALRPRLSYEHHLDELLEVYRRAQRCKQGGGLSPPPPNGLNARHGTARG